MGKQNPMSKWQAESDESLQHLIDRILMTVTNTTCNVNVISKNSIHAHNLTMALKLVKDVYKYTSFVHSTRLIGM